MHIVKQIIDKKQMCYCLSFLAHVMNRQDIVLLTFHGVTSVKYGSRVQQQYSWCHEKAHMYEIHVQTCTFSVFCRHTDERGC